MKKQIFISDKYKKARGGYSRLLQIDCAKCGHHICFYQKDGPGMLRRMYLDRIMGSEKYSKLQGYGVKALPQMICPSCKECIAVPMVYKKEQRTAYRLFVGSIVKKIVNSNTVKV